MSHPPTHPDWKRVVLIGGPNDGQELTIRGTRNLLVTGVTDNQEVDLHSVEKGAVYLSEHWHATGSQSTGIERFQFLGHRTTAEIRQLLRGGYVGGGRDNCGPEDKDDADWWKTK